MVSETAEQAAMIARVLPLGALAAVIGNALFGRLSDRTTSRFGRRRPWIIAGSIVLGLALLLLALATAEWQLTLGWFIAQLGANAAFSPFVATMADQLADEQYAKTSALIGIMQNLGIMVATWMGSLFETDMLKLFMVPAVIGFIGMVVYALMLPDPVLKANKFLFDFKTFIGTFWTNPIKFPDIGMAWWGRFFITLGSFMFTTFRLQYMTSTSGSDRPTPPRPSVSASHLHRGPDGLELRRGMDLRPHRQAQVAGGAVNRTVRPGHRRAVFADTVPAFYACEVLLGIAYGIYVAVDIALVLEVLPNPADSGKDLGVFNMANALPQSLAPALGGWLLATLGGGTNFGPLLFTAGAIALVGALVIIPIKSVK